ncbi:MAG: hypothetical protein H0V30_13760 [Chitinophagaceae bacterium]|jgi:hypothetical protein|nr:hypothetical protein [Chitinophagaceae bacterium]
MKIFRQGELPPFEFKEAIKKPVPVKCYQMNEPFEVETLEGTLKGKAGDYLMIGIQGEMYAIDKDIFDETYEIID